MMSITSVQWEIWCRANGRLASFPADNCPSLEAARESAEWLARGDMINAKGDRGPSRPIYELEPGEDLADVTEDGLFIFKRVTVREAMLNY
jgi:hypothetical protein